MKILIFEFIFKVISTINIRLSLILKKNSSHESDIEMILKPEDFTKLNFNLPSDYKLRYFCEEDLLSFYLLMTKINMGFCPLSFWKKYILPGGFFVVEDINKNKIIGTGFAAIHPESMENEVGTLEWLACHPDYGGIGIGSLISTKISERLIDEEFKTIRLTTQKHRKKAISMYEKLGWHIKR